MSDPSDTPPPSPPPTTSPPPTPPPSPPAGPPPPPPPPAGPPPPPPPPKGSGANEDGPSSTKRRKLLGVGLGALATVALLAIIGIAVGDNDEEVTTRETRAPMTTRPPALETTTSTPPPTTAAPTTTTPPEPVVLEGSGTTVEVLPQPLRPAEIVTMTHTGGSNFAIWAESDQGERLELLVNDIGPYAGTVLYEADAPASLLNITADGAWRVEIKPINQAVLWNGDGPLTGSSDEVAGIINGLPELTVVDVTHTGSRNFAIWVYNNDGRRELLINEIGAYAGSIRFTAGTLVVAIKADGDWTITPR